MQSKYFSENKDLWQDLMKKLEAFGDIEDLRKEEISLNVERYFYLHLLLTKNFIYQKT